MKVTKNFLRLWSTRKYLARISPRACTRRAGLGPGCQCGRSRFHRPPTSTMRHQQSIDGTVDFDVFGDAPDPQHRNRQRPNGDASKVASGAIWTPSLSAMLSQSESGHYPPQLWKGLRGARASVNCALPEQFEADQRVFFVAVELKSVCGANGFRRAAQDAPRTAPCEHPDLVFAEPSVGALS